MSGDEQLPSTAGTGGAIHPDARATSPSTQDQPAMDVDEAAVEDKIAGIAAQTRVDVGGEGAERIADVLRQRFADAGIEVSDDERARLAEGIAEGS
ncbi:hypothetical protein [Microbacterium sp. CJ88]|uniref:hypothetical protein n=1 Tax=Microbacterium sp. CJ88 TaxID=3445672 RepID=UPI003F658A45